MKGCEFMSSLNGGYAMIKYNSTQEELQIAYRSKRPVLFYDENQRSHWAVIEETATESVDEETQEPITLYEYSYKLLNDIEALVDSNGNPRFIGGNGTPQPVSGMTVASSKWSLNGTNLMFEILGTFSGNINTNETLCTFALPNWICNKIHTATNNIIDAIDYILATMTSLNRKSVLLVNNGNDVIFTQIDNIIISEPVFFRIRYNIIIDDL